MLTDCIGIPQLRDLAARNAEMHERLAVADMPRLAAQVFAGAIVAADGEGPAESTAGDEAFRNDALEVSVTVMAGERYPNIRMRARGQLTLQCQRCLGQLPWAVALDCVLTAVSSETERSVLADPFDSILVEAGGLRLADVFEDELLGLLPLAPVHERPEDCTGQPPEESDPLPERRTRPFADLRRLMNGGDERDTN